MSEHTHLEATGSGWIESPKYLSFSRQVILWLMAAAIVGGICILGSASLYTNGMRRTMLAYLVALAFVLSLSLGSLFFVLIQHLTRAGWAVLIRRPAEVFALNIVTVAALAIPIAWSAFSGQQSIYPWARVGTVSESEPTALAASSIGDNYEKPDATTDGLHKEILLSHSQEGHDLRSHLYIHQSFDELTASKTPWLNPRFFVLRLVIYFSLWTIMAGFYFRRSQSQDAARGEIDTRMMERRSGPAMFAFGISLTFAAFDLLMSLDPHWYSTIFGVYYFAGCAIGGFAVSLLSWLVLSRLGLAPARLPDEHLRDLGRLLFAFVFFWGYIAFSQYLLLWYANIPETTRWWAVRGASLAEGYRNSWGLLLVLLLFGHFIVPFLGIMSRHVKGNRKAMIFWTLWMLVMHYLDLVWLVMPEFGSSIVFGLPELGTMLTVGSLYLLGASYIATLIAIVPVGDPRLKASLTMVDAY